MRHDGAYLYALLGQNVTDVHLTAAMVAACLSPQLRCMRRKRLAHGSDDALIFGQQLPHKLQTNASAGPKNEPSGEVLVGI